jgi:hypothetical protein
MPWKLDFYLAIIQSAVNIIGDMEITCDFDFMSCFSKSHSAECQFILQSSNIVLGQETTNIIA